jgi:hypothetical protein
MIPRTAFSDALQPNKADGLLVVNLAVLNMILIAIIATVELLRGCHVLIVMQFSLIPADPGRIARFQAGTSELGRRPTLGRLGDVNAVVLLVEALHGPHRQNG